MYREAREAALVAARSVSPVPHDGAIHIIADAVSDVWRDSSIKIITSNAVRDMDQRDELNRYKDLLRQASNAYNDKLGDLSEEVLGTILGIIVPDLLGLRDV
jgi:hypothetical protein